MEDWNGNKLINALYKYLNTNKHQVKESNYNARSGYFFSSNVSQTDFLEYFSREQPKCPDLTSVLSIYTKDTDINIKKVNSQIELIKERLSDGTTLFNDYGFLFNNQKITKENIVEILNTLIEYAYRSQFTVFWQDIARLSSEDFDKTIDIPKFRKTIISKIISHKKILLYGDIGTGKTRLIKYILRFYDFKDVYYTSMDNSLSNTINYCFQKGSIVSRYNRLSEITKYNNALLVIDNYYQIDDDYDMLKELLNSNISVILISNEHKTYSSLYRLKKSWNISDFCVHKMPKFSKESLIKIINTEYSCEKDHSLVNRILEYSGCNPLLISLICTSLSEGTTAEKIFEVLESLKKRQEIPSFRHSYSLEKRDTSRISILGHFEEIYTLRLDKLKGDESEVKLFVLFGISCFGWDQIPRSLIVNYFYFLRDFLCDSIDLSINPEAIITELVNDKYIQTDEAKKYVSINPLLGNIIFSQYSQKKKTNKPRIFNEFHVVSLYKALDEYLDSHHLHYEDNLECKSIRIFIQRTYTLIAPFDNSSVKNVNVSKKFDFIHKTTIKAFHFCWKYGNLYDTNQILKSLRHLEEYHSNSSKYEISYASNTYTIFDHKILKLIEAILYDERDTLNISHNNIIVDQIDSLLNDLLQYGASGINPKNINEFDMWRQATLLELGLYDAIDKVILSLISLPTKDIDFNVLLKNIAATTILWMKTTSAIVVNDGESHIISNNYTTIILYISNFFFYDFCEVPIPQYNEANEALDDYLYKLSIWISLKNFNIIWLADSIDDKLQKYNSEIKPAFGKLISIFTKKLIVIPTYIMIPFIRVLQTLDTAISYLNDNLKKEDQLSFPISKDNLDAIFKKRNMDYRNLKIKSYDISPDESQKPDTSENTTQTE